MSTISLLLQDALQRARPFADLHFRQKWRAVWRQLSALPADHLHVLDAGCGDGRWAIEIALRRPTWTVTGIDLDPEAIRSAEMRRQRLGVGNVRFYSCDYGEFVSEAPMDVVLAICSIHYGKTPHDTELLFRAIQTWLRPGGRLVCLMPRCRAEVSFVPLLAQPEWQSVFSAPELRRLCADGGLAVDHLTARIGRVGALAKQLDWSRTRVGPPTGLVFRVAAQALAALDLTLPAPRRRSLMWLLVARYAA